MQLLGKVAICLCGLSCGSGVIFATECRGLPKGYGTPTEASHRQILLNYRCEEARDSKVVCAMHVHPGYVRELPAAAVLCTAIRNSKHRYQLLRAMGHACQLNPSLLDVISATQAVAKRH